MDEYKATNYYGTDLKLVNKILSRKGEKENTVELSYNGQQVVFPLATFKKEHREVIYRKPHTLLTKHWDSRIEQLQNYVSTQLSRTTDEAPAEIANLKSNLFVNEAMADIVTKNLKEVASILADLQLRLEKAQHIYAV